MEGEIVFDFKMRVIGFYNKIDQRMAPERKDSVAAEALASLLKQSFRYLAENPAVDGVFRSVLKGNSVFILKGENGKLYAYYPPLNIARINGVKYDKEDVTPVPLVYKGWFLPGENIPFIKDEPSNSRRNNKAKCEYIVSRNGRDFLIDDGNEKLPLHWSEDEFISFSELRELLSHPYTTLVKFETHECCGNCDGYDYSYCDMDRCKEDCENCGGRRLICHDGCFYYRYDKAVYISVSSEADNLILPIVNELKVANTPHCKEYNQIYSQVKPKIEFMEAELKPLLSRNFYTSAYYSLQTELKLYHKLSIARDEAHSHEGIRIFDVKVPSSKVTVCKQGFLFWQKWHIISNEDAYDYERDQFVRFDYKLDTAEEGLIGQIINCIKNRDNFKLRTFLMKVKVKERTVSYLDNAKLRNQLGAYNF